MGDLQHTIVLFKWFLLNGLLEINGFFSFGPIVLLEPRGEHSCKRKATKERDDGIKQVTHWSEAGIFTFKGTSAFSGFAESKKC
jgi:hypothetical protein